MKLALKLMVCILMFAVSTQAYSTGTCTNMILGGSDAFPWSVAEPFPWKSIQGVWRVHNNSDMLFQFKVTNPNKKNRRIVVQVYSRENCAEPLYKVPGVISETQRNVLNFQIDDKLMKLAWFNSASLKMNPNQCGEYVMAASIIGSADAKNLISTRIRVDAELPPIDQGGENSDTENFFLKKLSNSIEIYCKRKI